MNGGPLAALALLLLFPSSASAQKFAAGSFFFEPGMAGANRYRFHRLELGAYFAAWDFAPTALNQVAAIELEADPGPLVTLDYHLSQRWSIGGWVNPISAEVTGLHQGRRLKLADQDMLFWDIHAAYALPDRPLTRGVTVQLGYSALSNEVEVTPLLRLAGATDEAFTQTSPSLWINKVQHLKTARGRRPGTSLFGSLGYYFTSDFDHDWNLIVGASVGLRDRLAANASLWLNGFDADPRTRFTVGLTGYF